MSEIECDSETDTKWSRGRKAVPGKGGGCPVDTVEFKGQADMHCPLPYRP